MSLDTTTGFIVTKPHFKMLTNPISTSIEFSCCGGTKIPPHPLPELDFPTALVLLERRKLPFTIEK